jgi:hypothetical protein
MKTKSLVLCATITLSWAHSGLADQCSSAVGTWTASYKIVSEFTDTFTVQSVARNGDVRAENEFGDSMRGWCKKGVMYLVEEQASIYSSGYYFLSNGKFGRHSGTTKIGSTPYDVAWYTATMDRVAFKGPVSNRSGDEDAERNQKAAEQESLRQ